jgi:hypothetical protein
MNDHCPQHEEFLIAVTTLSGDVKAMRWMFKGAMSVMLTVTIFLAGITATFAYKASGLYAQVQVNTTEIVNHKEIPHGR